MAERRPSPESALLIAAARQRLTASMAGFVEMSGLQRAEVDDLIAAGELRVVRLTKRGRRFITMDSYIEWLQTEPTPQRRALPSLPARASRPVSVAPSVPRHIGYVVYFIEAKAAKLIKIGWSGSIEQRVKNLRVTSPLPLQVLGCIPGDVLLERELHERFAKERKHNEWFQASPRLRDFIAGILAEKGVQIDV